ncbi:hypothetical protein [Roseicella frigidaeris]|uniref:hypothetical protein n=1 Tax=Roseicella frigidaeris TaxID=2230885 RepID=UPI00140290C4|nr:hypothetical protein [Roseicella frigidaeris]
MAVLLGLSPPAAADTWTTRLPALLPALQACLAGLPDAFAAESEAEGRVRVRLRQDGGTEDCVAIAGRVASRAPLADAPPPDAAAPAFFLERRCADARRVEAPDGRILGWLAYPACR